jgi:hypothetical protein
MQSINYESHGLSQMIPKRASIGGAGVSALHQFVLEVDLRINEGNICEESRQK